jgi:hypothetical protein
VGRRVGQPLLVAQLLLCFSLPYSVDRGPEAIDAGPGGSLLAWAPILPAGPGRTLRPKRSSVHESGGGNQSVAESSPAPQRALAGE